MSHLAPMYVSYVYHVCINNHNVPEPMNFLLTPKGCNHYSHSVTEVTHQPLSFATETQRENDKKSSVPQRLRQEHDIYKLSHIRRT